MSVVMHPRPSPTAAAMYTLRDLDVDVIVLHGPSGCCFRPARLLEKEGVKIFTSALSEEDLIFGGEKKLFRVLKRVDELFKPRLIGLVGSCASLIIGEDLKKAAEKANVLHKTICCEVHGCAGDNTAGAIVVLREALAMGLISSEEFKRQQEMLEKASWLERTRGTARGEYIGNCPGDSPERAAEVILEVLKSGGKVACVLNAKKETVFLYADVLLAVEEARRKLGGKVLILANLDPRLGLPRIRGYAGKVLDELMKKGVVVDSITGGLDEYPVCGERARQIILEARPDLAVIAGIPHAVAVEGVIKTVAVTVGSRAVANLKALGYDYVVEERDAHQVCLGPGKKIQKSLLGMAIRRKIGR